MHYLVVSVLLALIFLALRNKTWAGVMLVIALLLELIELEEPDLIFLQEVTDVWVAAMAQLEDRYPHHHAIARDDNFGIAVYAREPLLNIETVDSPPMNLPTLVARQSINGTTRTFVTTHPFPPMGNEWTQARNVQLESLGTLMNSIDGPKALFGDLNITMWAHHYRELIDATKLRNARQGFGVVPRLASTIAVRINPD